MRSPSARSPIFPWDSRVARRAPSLGFRRAAGPLLLSPSGRGAGRHRGPASVPRAGRPRCGGSHRHGYLPGSRSAISQTEARRLRFWIDDDTFVNVLEACLENLARAGFKVVVAHGHGPSTTVFRNHLAHWEVRFGLRLIHLQNELEDEELGFMSDHAATNETSLMMALHPDWVNLLRSRTKSLWWASAERTRESTHPRT